MQTKPKNINLWRAGANCRIGKDVLNGVMEKPLEATRVEYALFCLLSAVDDLVEYLEERGGRD